MVAFFIEKDKMNKIKDISHVGLSYLDVIGWWSKNLILRNFFRCSLYKVLSDWNFLPCAYVHMDYSVLDFHFSGLL